MHNNVALYNEYIHQYTDYKLYPAEHIILGKFQERWPNFKMLDIGIGTGRTTHTFAPMTRHYTGIDYAEVMLEQCRKIIPPRENINLIHCDARDLSQFYDRSFDFIMFSLNGIDSVNHDDRIKILKEVKKVLARDGYFFFSSHSLRGFKYLVPAPKFKWYSPVKSLYHLYRNLKYNWRMKNLYDANHVQDIRKADWKIVKTGDHDFKMDIYHVNPVFQVRQLDESGYQVESIYALYGRIENVETTQANTLYYLCKLK